MCHDAVNWVINRVAYPKEVKPPARWLLVHIADRADKNAWSCWPSHKTLANDAGMSVRSVVDLLFVLENVGLITRTPTVRADGKRSTDVITIVDSYATIARGTERDIRRDRAQHSTEKSANVAEQNHVTEPRKGTDIVLHAPDPFDAWWLAYPRKMAKVSARKAWAKVPDSLAKTGLTLSDLMERTRSFADHVVGKDPEHIAHPATWLNGERWNDELPDRSQTDGKQTTRPDRGANQHTARVDAMVDGARQALAQRRRWSFSG
jgi:hypothetical protein